MNANTPLENDTGAAAMPARLRSLWAEACNWVAWLASMFDRNTLKTTGVSREQGARISIWLMNIEGAIRRLILAAALAFTPPAQRASRAGAARAPVAAASARRPGFRVFRLRGAVEAAPRETAPATPRTAKAYGHIPFPADPLLCIGHAPQRPPLATRESIPRARNPLDRWVRPSRQDPDWRAPEDSDFFFRDNASRERSRDNAARPRTRLKPKAQLTAPDDIPPSLLDWRRRYDAWTQPVPAPDLAARLEALARVIANPMAAIASTARRLRASNSAPALLPRTPPDLSPPRRAAHIATAGHTQDFLKRCCEAALDTS